LGMGEGKVRYRTSFSPKKSLRFWRGGLSGHIPQPISKSQQSCAEICKQSLGATYRPAKLITWNRFLGSLKV
jgi:hypothetical protein